MSHVTATEVEGGSLSALRAAVEAMGGQFMEGQKTFEWYGQFLNDWDSGRAAVNQGYDPKTFGKCTHAIRIPGHKSGNYEIGVQVKPDGTFTLIYDTWSSGGEAIEKAYGKDASLLKALCKAHHGAQVSARELKRKGYAVTHEVDEFGRPRVVGRKA